MYWSKNTLYVEVGLGFVLVFVKGFGCDRLLGTILLDRNKCVCSNLNYMYTVLPCPCFIHLLCYYFYVILVQAILGEEGIELRTSDARVNALNYFSTSPLFATIHFSVMHTPNSVGGFEQISL